LWRNPLKSAGWLAVIAVHAALLIGGCDTAAKRPVAAPPPAEAHRHFPVSMANLDVKIVRGRAVSEAAQPLEVTARRLVRTQTEQQPSSLLDKPYYTPDRTQTLFGASSYTVVFQPSIVPFKRMQALDYVVLGPDQKTAVLTLRDATPSREVAIEPAAQNLPEHDVFNGDVVLDFTQEDKILLPNVAPHARVVRIHSYPKTSIRLLKDGADNLYAVADPRPTRRVHLTLVVAVPWSYFGGALDPVQTHVVQQMPAVLTAKLRQAAALLGLKQGMRSDQVIIKLTEHFRGFEESSIERSDDDFVDLVRQRKGLCRQRAYAFVVLAQWLGLHARYVQNEAHVWVEVEQAPGMWRRIDLGGSPQGVRLSGVAKGLHKPKLQDALPKPQAYVALYQIAPKIPIQNSALAANTRRPMTTPQGLRVELSWVSPTTSVGNALFVQGNVVDNRLKPVPQQRVEVYLGPKQLIGVALTDADGRFGRDFHVPLATAGGTHTLSFSTPLDQLYMDKQIHRDRDAF